jgi:MFS family permease
LSVGLGLSYGPQAAMYAEMFPANVRYSGVSIGYALGAILGGAFAPTIAQILLEATNWSGSVGIYIMVTAAISFVGVTLAGETRGNNLRAVDARRPHVDEAPGAASASGRQP